MPVLSPRFQPAKYVKATLALFASIMWMLSDMPLADAWSTISGHLEDALLLDLPSRLYRSPMFSGMISISWMILEEDLILDLLPEPESDEVAHECAVEHHELPEPHPAQIEVRCEGFEALVVPEDLACGRSWHRCDEQRVPHPMFDDLRLEAVPIPTSGMFRDTPEVKLQLPCSDCSGMWSRVPPRWRDPSMRRMSRSRWSRRCPGSGRLLPAQGILRSAKVSARPWTPNPTGRWRMFEFLASTTG